MFVLLSASTPRHVVQSGLLPYLDFQVYHRQLQRTGPATSALFVYTIRVNNFVLPALKVFKWGLYVLFHNNVFISFAFFFQNSARYNSARSERLKIVS